MEKDGNVLDTIPDAVIITDPAGSIVFWSAGARRTYGHSASDVTGKGYNAVLVHENQHPDSAATQLALDNSEGTYEAIRKHRDGSTLYVDISRTTTVDTESGNELTLSIEKDITRQKSLRDAEVLRYQFGALLESVPDAILLVNSAGRIVLSNKVSNEIFGYAAGALLAEPVELLLPPAARQEHVSQRDHFMKHSAVRAMGKALAVRGLHASGREFEVEIRLASIPSPMGTLTMSAVRDISSRVKTENQFRDLLESAPDAMVIVDRDGRIVLVNSQAESLFGYRREDLVGKPVELLVPAHLRSRHTSHRRLYTEEPTIRPMASGPEIQLYGLRSDNSEFPVEISLSPLVTEEGTLISSAIRDVSQRRKMEQALRESNEQLFEANRAKDRFLSSISHELRTPLNAIIGFTGTLLMQLPGPLNEEQRKQMQIIKRSGNHLLSLINDLLDLAKVNAGKFELTLGSIGIQPVVDEVVTSLKPAATEKGLWLDVHAIPAGYFAHADGRAVRQILLNLVANAIKFTSTGSITIEAECDNSGEENSILVRVRDTGPGIEVDDCERIFEPFVQGKNRTNPEAGGTGLGLSLSRKLARLMRGDVTCSSTGDDGSTFTLRLQGGLQ